MRKRIAAVALGFAVIGVPAAAQGLESKAKHESILETRFLEARHQLVKHNWRPYEKRYLELRREYVKQFGLRAAGRDIVRDGYRENDGDVREARRSEVTRSIQSMDGALHPVTATTTATATTTTAYTATSSSTVMCESGGDYSANTGNGFYGGYQFDSGTWDAYGDPAYAEASDAPPAVQDAAAASVPYDAWPSC
jgi:transglycosylase-like protein